jgi:hypothetical protein
MRRPSPKSSRGLRRHRVLILVREARIEEVPQAVHLGLRYVGIPVGHGPEAGPGAEVHAGEAERRRNERARLLSVRAEGLAILVEDRVVAARSPAREHLLHGGLVDPEEVGERLEIGGERDDGADVQVAVGPAVQALADAGGERVVDVRVAERALDAERLDPPGRVELAGHSHHGVQLEERKGRRGIVEVHLARLDLRDELRRQGFRIHLEPDRKRGLRAYASAEAAVFFTGDGLVQLQGIAPESLRAEGVEAEDPPAVLERALRVLADLAIALRKGLLCGARCEPTSAEITNGKISLRFMEGLSAPQPRRSVRCRTETRGECLRPRGIERANQRCRARRAREIF